MLHSVKISRAACQGCVNCIRVCPTEAIRIVDGEISILEELCIDCGECLRSCHRQALGIEEDDWNAVKENPKAAIVADPVFFSQFSHYNDPSALEAVLASMDVNLLMDEIEEAFDLSAAATATLRCACTVTQAAPSGAVPITKLRRSPAVAPVISRAPFPSHCTSPPSALHTSLTVISFRSFFSVSGAATRRGPLSCWRARLCPRAV